MKRNWKSELKELEKRGYIEILIYSEDPLRFELFPHSRYAKMIIDEANEHYAEMEVEVKAILEAKNERND